MEELCRLGFVREPQLPAITELLAPQRWSPYGKAGMGACSVTLGAFRLEIGFKEQVLEIHGNYIIDFQGQTLSPMIPWVMLVMSLSNPWNPFNEMDYDLGCMPKRPVEPSSTWTNYIVRFLDDGFKPIWGFEQFCHNRRAMPSVEQGIKAVIGTLVV